MSRTAFAVALAATLGSGCLVAPRTVHTVGTVAAAALWTAAIVGTVTILVTHDEHYHHDHCGHYRRWHDDHWIYYYGGRWEYYDDSSDSWFYYAE